MEKKKESRSRHSGAWVESTFTTESTSNPKRRRLDTHPDLADDAPKPKAKVKPTAWVASEFSSPQASPSKPPAPRNLPGPRDRNSLGTNLNSFIFTGATPDRKPKKHALSTSLAVQPAPVFSVPKMPHADSPGVTDDAAVSAIQAPAFRASTARATDLLASGDVIALHPLRIEPKPGHDSSAQEDKDLVPLTNLITPRLFGLAPATSAKGKDHMANSDEQSIQDDQAHSTLITEDAPTDAEPFTMRELADGLEGSPSKSGRTGSTRIGSNKFVKGGLAARAHMLISQREKDDALWYHHTNSKLSGNPNLREDLRVNVFEILQSVGVSVLARCQILPADAARLNLAPVVDTNQLVQPMLVDVLLSMHGSKAVVGVEPGATLRLWRPWIEVDLNVRARIPSPALDDETTDDAGLRTRSDDHCAELKKEEISMYPGDKDSRSSSKNLAPNIRPRRAFLCSRFIVG